jgi:hypothetical protein
MSISRALVCTRHPSYKCIHPVANKVASPSIRRLIPDYQKAQSFVVSDHRRDENLLAVEFVAVTPGIWVVRRHIRPRFRQATNL